MKCPICGKESSEILTKHLRRGKGIVYYCTDCNHGMLQPAFDNAVDYYNEEYRKKFKDAINEEGEENPEELFEMRKDYQKDRVRIISDYYDSQKTFLEIGCSAGMFIDPIYKHFKKVEAIELSSKCADYVKRRWNIEVYTKTLHELIDYSAIDRGYDYIGFFQVLEHIENPVEFMMDVRQITNENGRIFIEIPNLDDPLRVLWNVPSYETFYYHEAHLSYFSEQSIKRLLEKTGWHIEKIYYLQDYNLLNNLYWFFNNAPQPTCEFGLNPPHIQFQEGERIREAGNDINKLLLEMNEEYFRILSKYKITSNMFIIAKK